MTVDELIDELNKVGDKSKEVTIHIELQEGIGVKDVGDTDSQVIIYNWI